MQPLVFVHILAKDKEPVLPLYLETLDNWDYPKDRIIIYLRTNNNSDATADILAEWVEAKGGEYKSLLFDSMDVAEPITDTGSHDWTQDRLEVIRRLRDEGLSVARRYNADFYFTSDVDNFIAPDTLSSLVGLDLPVVAPLLRYAYDPNENAKNQWANPWYSNFANKVNDYGDVMDHPDYYPLLERSSPGIHEVELVHATYLIRRDVLSVISYQNGTMGWDYIIFASNLRRAGIPQLLDNRKVYGCMTLAENEPACRLMMQELGFLKEKQESPSQTFTKTKRRLRLRMWGYFSLLMGMVIWSLFWWGLFIWAIAR